MNKPIITVFLMIFLISFVSAVPDITVKKINRGSVIVSELGNSANFDLVINNSGEKDMFEIYTLVGVAIEPSGKFELDKGETTVSIRTFPNENILMTREGFLSFEYQIRARNSGIFKDSLYIEIIRIGDTVEVRSNPISPGDSEAVLFLKNKENLQIDDLDIKLESPFFVSTEKISFGPLEEKRISIPLNKESGGTAAGAYLINAEISVNGKQSDAEGVINFLEKEETTVEESSYGFILRKTVLTKTNIGNIAVDADLELKKDFISRLFTTVSSEPKEVVRDGGSVTYIWEENLNPGESLEVEVTTNYTVPFVLLVIIILVGVLVRVYSRKAVYVHKSVSFVRTKGGEFALKVKLRVAAKKAVDKIHLTDTLPSMTELYEQFGKKPDKIDKHTRKLQWNIGSLAKGEERVYSYIIYSKINVVGRFELPPAMATFEKEGKFQEVMSNRAFFAAEKG